MRLSLNTIAEWTGGRAVRAEKAPDDAEVCAVCIDSRHMRSRSLFVALEGPNHDGHAFVTDALSRGGVAALVSREEALGGAPGVVVPHTLAALGQLAHRFRWNEPLIPWAAVTGSNGKTSTREILAHILRLRGVVASPRKNFNNLVGMPLSILDCPEDAWAGVLEMGASEPGEIRRLAEIGQPTVSIVTCVAPAHLEGFGALETVADEKGSIYDFLPEDGLAVYPANDPFADILLSHVKGRRASFAVGWDADLIAEDVEIDAHGSRFRVRGHSVRLPFLGIHSVSNCLAAMLAAEFLGVSVRDAAEAVETLQPVPDRLQAIATEHLTILDDVYNANPGSLRAAVETMVLFDASRHVCIIGDMMELGSQCRQLHRDAGRYLATLGMDVILAVGPRSVALAEAASTACARCKVRHYATVQSLSRDIGRYLHPGDAVLVKGSRGMQLERIVKRLRQWKPAARKD